jgi:hypothetical protein
MLARAAQMATYLVDPVRGPILLLTSFTTPRNAASSARRGASVREPAGPDGALRVAARRYPVARDGSTECNR